MSKTGILVDTEKINTLLKQKGLRLKDLSDHEVSLRTLQLMMKEKKASQNTVESAADKLGIDARLLYDRQDGQHNYPPELERHMVYYDGFMNDRAGRNFVGREFLFDHVSDFTKKNRQGNGYLLIQGDPGIGKSAFMAALVQRESLGIYHFNIALEGRNKPRDFLGNVCARLIVKYGLPYNRLPDDYDQDSRFLTQILDEAAATLDDEGKIVIVIDALDEVDNPENKPNPLFLPLSLPKGVYFILTARNREDIRIHGDVTTLKIDNQDEENKKDAQAYIRRFPHENGVTKWKQSQNLSDDEFVETLLESSEANFMYLRHVLPAIDRGEFTNGGISDLPHGLKSYYQHHWRQMQNQLDQFDELYRPVVCVLAAVNAPVPIDDIAYTTGLEPQQIQSAIKQWKEFLHSELKPGQPDRYCVYHMTFREYLQDEVDPGLLTYHAMLADAGLRKLDELQ